MTAFSLFLILTVAVLLAGCGDGSKAAKAVNTVSNLVDAPVNYVGAGKVKFYAQILTHGIRWSFDDVGG